MEIKMKHFLNTFVRRLNKLSIKNKNHISGFKGLSQWTKHIFAENVSC